MRWEVVAVRQKYRTVRGKMSKVWKDVLVKQRNLFSIFLKNSRGAVKVSLGKIKEYKDKCFGRDRLETPSDFMRSHGTDCPLLTGSQRKNTRTFHIFVSLQNSEKRFTGGRKAKNKKLSPELQQTWGVCLDTLSVLALKYCWDISASQKYTETNREQWSSEVFVQRLCGQKIKQPSCWAVDPAEKIIKYHIGT